MSENNESITKQVIASRLPETIESLKREAEKNDVEYVRWAHAVANAALCGGASKGELENYRFFRDKAFEAWGKAAALKEFENELLSPGQTESSSFSDVNGQE